MDNWTILQDNYQERGVTLFLGAGASVGLGVPSWDGLLEDLLKEYCAPATISELRDAGLSTEAIASVVEDRCGGRKQFVGAVRKALYKGFTTKFGWPPQGDVTSERKHFPADIPELNPTLAAAGAFCVRKAETGFERNPRVHSVVTFNFDDLFTLFVKHRYNSDILRVTEVASNSSRPGSSISCYHAHGLLRFEAGKAATAEDMLVLTERSFFDFFNQPNAFFNYTMMYLLREHHCLFLGCSLRDNNIRRLLHYSATERTEHYVIEKGKKMESPDYQKRAKLKPLRHFALFERSAFKGQSGLMWTESLRSLGVQPLWVDKWEEVPERMGVVYGGDWSKVFERKAKAASA